MLQVSFFINLLFFSQKEFYFGKPKLKWEEKFSFGNIAVTLVMYWSIEGICFRYLIIKD